VHVVCCWYRAQQSLVLTSTLVNHLVKTPKFCMSIMLSHPHTVPLVLLPCCCRSVCGAPQASSGSSEVDPRPGLVRPDVALMCVHGFGGGVFAWRHLMQPLADAVGVRVVAFDRPGFGERPCSLHPHSERTA
jgi:pimeloyl-ACP methyl ester carboxylesterase